MFKGLKPIVYGGREGKSDSLFNGGECVFRVGSSGSAAGAEKALGAENVGIGMMPYDPSVRAKPQNSIIGGATLWVLQGKPKAEYVGVAKFMTYLSSTPVQAKWHQDTGYTFTNPQHYLTCWVSLNGATVDNGCPWVLPGAFRNGTYLHRWVDPIGWQCLDEVDGAVPAEVPAGGAVVFSSLTPHQTGPNLTAEARKAYIIQYGPAGMDRVLGDWESGAAPEGVESCDVPERQYPVLRNGLAVGGRAATSAGVTSCAGRRSLPRRRYSCRSTTCRAHTRRRRVRSRCRSTSNSSR